MPRGSSRRNVSRHLLKPMSVQLRQVSSVESVLVAAAPRPASNEDSPPAAGLWLGGLRRSFVTCLWRKPNGDTVIARARRNRSCPPAPRWDFQNQDGSHQGPTLR